VITVATWNVLHRVHAQNWSEDVVARWPDEPARIAAITARLAVRTERVIALQEVSGDQLTSLRDALPGRTVHAFRYPRVPMPRRDGYPLHDPGEHLVLLVDGPSRAVTAESFPDDPGKGALAVSVAGTLIVATHLSANRRHTRQLARLAELAAAAPVVAVLGDFNTDRATVTSGLGAGFAVADLPPDALPTRPGSPPMRIDHVAVRGAAVSGAAVEDVGGLSDHNLVRADITV
jgi:endonuclease/exonuclease/phosphatase family metal-dependent hydrolase